MLWDCWGQRHLALLQIGGVSSPFSYLFTVFKALSSLSSVFLAAQQTSSECFSGTVGAIVTWVMVLDPVILGCLTWRLTKGRLWEGAHPAGSFPGVSEQAPGATCCL